MFIAIMVGCAAVSGAAFVFLAKALAEELRARRDLARAQGIVEQVEHSRAGAAEGRSRATVAFTDLHGQQRRFKTDWSENHVSQGDVVTVGYHATKAMPPRLFTASGIAGQVFWALIPGAIAGASLFVLLRVWLTRS